MKGVKTDETLRGAENKQRFEDVTKFTIFFSFKRLKENFEQNIMETIETIFEKLKKDNIWPGNLEQAWEVLLNAHGNENDSNLICQTDENDKLWEEIKKWNPTRIVKGALFCVFENKFQASKGLEI